MGDLQSLSSDGKLYYHNGVTSSPITTASSSDVLQNKKLEDSTVSFVDNADNTKQLKFEVSGVTTGTTRTLTVPNADTTIVGTDTTQTISNKTLTSNTIDADLNTITNIDNADIKAGAAIARSKLASGSANHVLINDGSGVMSSEATLAKSRGGSAQDNSSITFPASGVLTTNAGTQTLSNKTFSDSVTLAEIATPSTPTSGNGRIYFKSDGFLYQLNDDGSESKVGAGTSGINYIANPDAESNTTGWATYANVAANIPVDGTGGSATGLTFSSSSSSPLRGTKSFLLVQDNTTSLQGKGVAYNFTINSADKANVLDVSFNFNASSTFVTSDGITPPLNDGTTSTNAGNSDIEVFIYDVDNSSLIIPNPQVITAKGSNNFTYQGTFQSSSSSSNYRLILHVATTSANATGWQFKFDNVVVGPQILLYGAPISDWTAYTPTWSAGFGTVSSSVGYYRRIGDSLEILASCTSGTVAASIATVSLPSGLTMDTGKLPAPISVIGNYGTNFLGGHSTILSNTGTSSILAYFGQSTSSSNELTAVNGNVVTGNATTLAVHFTIPVLGWGSSVLMSNDTDTRVCSALYSTSAGNIIANNSANTGEFACSTKIFDTHNAYNTTTAIFTAPISGIYRASSAFQFVNDANWSINEIARLQLYKNGSQVSTLGTWTCQATASQVSSASGSALVQVNAGDTLEVRLFQNSGATAGLQTDGNNNYTNFERISGPSVIAANEVVAARYKTSSSFAISHITYTIMDYSSKDFDTHGSVTTGGSWKFTAPINGIFRVSANGYFDPNSTSARELALFKNGSRVCALGGISICSGTQSASFGGSSTIQLIAGDYIDVRIWQNSGIALATTGDSAFQWVSIEKIGN